GCKEGKALMAILVMCTNRECGEMMHAPDSAAGRQGRCPVCGTIVTIPAGAAGGSSGAAQASLSDDDRADGRMVILDVEASTSAPGAADMTASAQIPLEVASSDEDQDAPIAVEPLEPVAVEEPIAPDLPADSPSMRPASPQPADDVTLITDDLDWEVSAAGVGQATEPAGIPAGEGSQPWEPIVVPDEAGGGVDASFVDLEEFANDSAAPGAEAPQPLETRTGFMAVFGFGLAGTCIGFVIGWACMPGNRFMGAYIGSGVGWVTGFILSLMAVSSTDHPDESSHACPRVGTDALMKTCLRAYQYGSSPLVGILAIVGLSLFSHLVMFGAVKACAHGALGSETAWAVMALAVIVECFFVAYVLSVCLKIIKNTMTKMPRAPQLVGANPLVLVGVALRGLALVMLYVFPLVTIPLLPLGVLAAGRFSGAGAFDLRWAGRAAMRYPAPLATLWLMLLLWGAVMAVVLAVIVLGGSALVGLLPVFAGYQKIIIDLVIYIVAVVIISFVAAGFSCIMFHCVGIFGLQNSRILDDLPRKATRRTAMVLVAALIISAAVTFMALHPMIFGAA
ncbi:MAG: hypothetical protein J7M14_06560, partial [Planctomycetes bacterium]|nr:hypothetical protein [Planctomycetota bacterium]